jgi:hypothetical protein
MTKYKLFSYFDTSNYSKSHYYYNNTKKNKPGFFKNEIEVQISLEFITLRPKLYAYRVNEKEVKRAKSAKKYVVKKNIKFKEYFDILNI